MPSRFSGMPTTTSGWVVCSQSRSPPAQPRPYPPGFFGLLLEPSSSVTAVTVVGTTVYFSAMGALAGATLHEKWHASHNRLRPPAARLAAAATGFMRPAENRDAFFFARLAHPAARREAWRQTHFQLIIGMRLPQSSSRSCVFAVLGIKAPCSRVGEEFLLHRLFA